MYIWKWENSIVTMVNGHYRNTCSVINILCDYFYIWCLVLLTRKDVHDTILYNYVKVHVLRLSPRINRATLKIHQSNGNIMKMDYFMRYSNELIWSVTIHTWNRSCLQFRLLRDSGYRRYGLLLQENAGVLNQQWFFSVFLELVWVMGVTLVSIWLSCYH